MKDVDRISKLRDAAGSLCDGLASVEEAVLSERLSSLTREEFERLCNHFRRAEVLQGLRGYLRHLLVYAASGGILFWGMTRVSAHWLILLMLLGVVLILVSLCLDALDYVELERRCARGLHLRVSDVVFGGNGPIAAVREFRRSLDRREPAA